MNALELFENHRTILDQELKQFIELYEGSQPMLIQALADKIKHMCVNIGSPSSVIPMLKSISNGKLKTWSTNWNSNGEKLRPGIHINEIDRNYEGNYVKGHFRWNFGKGYIADYYTRDYIKSFFINKNVKDFKRDNPKYSNIRLSISSSVARKLNNMYTVEVTTTKGNSYRFHYYPEDGTTTCNFSEDGKVTFDEKVYVKTLINNTFKTKF